MSDKVQQILAAAKLLRQGDVASGMKQIMGATGTSAAQDTSGQSTGTQPDPLATLGQPVAASGQPDPLATLAAATKPDLLATLAGTAKPDPLATLVATAKQADPLTTLAMAQPSFQGGQPDPLATLTAAAKTPDPLATLAAGQPSLPGLTPEVAPANLALTSQALPEAGGTSVAGAPSMPRDVTSASGGVGLDPKLVENVGNLRLRMMQEAAQQQFFAAYAQQVLEMQQLHEKQQEAAQLALIMEAAEAQAEMAKESLDKDQEEHHSYRRTGRKQTVCGNWQRGYCKHGDTCQFSHPEKEKGSSTIKRGPADLMRHNFKTAICRPFASNGSCTHGSRCMFAHGPQELRSPGQAVSKDEEEMIQRVAAGGKKTASAQAAIAGGTAPSVVAPLAGSAASQLAMAQMAALAGLTAGLPGQPPPPPPPAAGLAALTSLDQQQAQAQIMALAGLSGSGADGASFDLMQLMALGSTAEGEPRSTMVPGPQMSFGAMLPMGFPQLPPMASLPAALPGMEVAAVEAEAKRQKIG
mmetsp:Transcript_97429/g.275567  ORF Transcript_97429/g.275567 Transcript_97429/m.275567 type:complete len:526 (+) Transcript_97429:111-1688(+)